MFLCAKALYEEAGIPGVFTEQLMIADYLLVPHAFLLLKMFVFQDV